MKRMDTINVIPFIDIMLVLLAIVLTTATFLAEGRLDIRLPEAQGAAEANAHPRVEIGIDESGGLFLDAKPVGMEALGQRLDALAPQTPITLRVDARSRFEHFVGVVDLLEARSLQRLTILTSRP